MAEQLPNAPLREWFDKTGAPTCLEGAALDALEWLNALNSRALLNEENRARLERAIGALCGFLGEDKTP
jgi:hypothetical protein